MSSTREVAGQFSLEDWPVEDVLTKLADAVDRLLQDHDCDIHGYEGISYAAVAARMHVEHGPLRQQEQDVRAEEREGLTLLRSLVGKLCNFCDEEKPLTQWGHRKSGNLSFTHWTGFEHVPCMAASVYDYLDRRDSEAQEGEQRSGR